MKNKIQNTPDMTICSFDVVNLFTNIPVEEAIEIVKDIMKKQNIRQKTREDLIKIL